MAVSENSQYYVNSPSHTINIYAPTKTRVSFLQGLNQGPHVSPQNF
jgi:hypothetical protein